MEKRYLPVTFNIRESQDAPVIEGYFAVFGDVYQLWENATESIAPGAFTDCLNGDIRALYNHNHDIVLARTSAGTLTLRQDDNGLWGSIKLDPEDTDAMNAYRRIKRGSITGCSIGFGIGKESIEYRDDGSIHWTIEKIEPLYEISPCTFPAYEETSISARRKEFDGIIKENQMRMASAWRESMKARLQHGIKSTHAKKEN